MLLFEKLPDCERVGGKKKENSRVHIREIFVQFRKKYPLTIFRVQKSDWRDKFDMCKRKTKVYHRYIEIYAWL